MYFILKNKCVKFRFFLLLYDTEFFTGVFCVKTCLAENGGIKKFLTKELFSYLLPLTSSAGRVSGISKTSKALPYHTTGN